MKKIIKLLLVVIVLGFLGYFIYVNYINKVPKITPEEEKASVEEYYIYGNHLNIKGSLELNDKTYTEIKLVLYNGQDKEFDINTNYENNELKFYTSEYINEGIYIDDLDVSDYHLFLRLTYKEEKDKEKLINKYYILDNKTNYQNGEYYTLSTYNKKITINSNNEYNTMMLNVAENNDSNIYDITIDPGHGGMDGGGTSNGYKETDFTMYISEKIKENLENKGLKVKLTHEEGEISSNKVMEEYNKNGRAVISNEVKSKYTFSIHFNSNTISSVKGLEIYTPAKINYDFAKSLVESITNNTNLSTSTNKTFKVDDGIYTHNFSESEIANAIEGYNKKGYKPYNVTTDSNYLYMIRETGGYLTGAYVDNSNLEKVGENPYYNNNIANESYLLELGYLSNNTDLNTIISQKDELANAISSAIIKELNL